MKKNRLEMLKFQRIKTDSQLLTKYPLKGIAKTQGKPLFLRETN